MVAVKAGDRGGVLVAVRAGGRVKLKDGGLDHLPAVRELKAHASHLKKILVGTLGHQGICQVKGNGARGVARLAAAHAGAQVNPAVVEALAVGGLPKKGGLALVGVADALGKTIKVKGRDGIKHQVIGTVGRKRHVAFRRPGRRRVVTHLYN